MEQLETRNGRCAGGGRMPVLRLGRLADKEGNGNIEKFESLPAERQEAIVGAGVELFGRNDYKNASTDAIARKAGISKGLLFFYFKNKKEFYLYLMERLMDKMTDLVVDDKFYEIDDFFELMEYSASKKKAVFENMSPFLLDFSIRAFYPEHKDVKDTMDGWTQAQLDLMFSRFFKNVRFDRFRDDVSPRRVLDMMIWMADGYLHQQRCLKKAIDIDVLMEEFADWCAMLKAYAYKEEYR
ncbi:TetR/AcrR family transcriptional regulator [Gordonibacter sp. 28C]|uniref:TetR/AcrR family transcriptional regulator n=1 Tax=Gordonibacter sp. 28C TaxID=2078569 RepID=UPI001F5465F5|nr:TetR/AcrR family transcriptional regulator [Gordonibacter sp. 28C]